MDGPSAPMTGRMRRPRKLVHVVAGLVLATLGLVSTGFLDPAQAASEQLVVPGNQPWTDTGLTVAPGTVINISALGEINVYGGRADWYKTPAGGPNCIASPTTSVGQWIGMGLPCWSLIARIGQGPAFEVGTGITYTASSSGRLYLGVNDESLASFNDNSGTWTALVSTY
jgi:hypothetical protein